MFRARLLAVEVVEEEEMARLWGPKAERPGGLMGRGHSEAPPEDPNHPHREVDQGWPVTQAIAGAATLISAISLRASLLPAVSMRHAACRVSSRHWSIIMRALAIRSRVTP